MDKELMERLDIVESMIKEGRRANRYFGWVLVLWGAGFLAAQAWTLRAGTSAYPWPVVMGLCAVINVFFMRRKPYRGNMTASGQAIAAAWIVVAVALSLTGTVGHITRSLTGPPEKFVMFILLGAAHAISGLITRWRLQQLNAAGFWLAGIALLLLPAGWVWPVWFSWLAVGQIAFGLYLMMLERRMSRDEK